MSASKWIVALCLAGFAAVAGAEEPTAHQRQAKLRQEAAITLSMHAVHDAEREAILAARIMQVFQNEPPMLMAWTQCEPWLKAVVVMGATSLAALAAMACLAARPIARSPRA